MAEKAKRYLKTKRGEFELPMFLPVYQPKSSLVSIAAIKDEYQFRGLIVNGFFLYKDAEVKKRLLTEVKLHEHIGFDGLLMTDSGAFQGLKRPLYLNNKKIVKFQNAIGADIISPLDLISPPGDNFTTASKKLKSTIKRIREAKPLAENSILAGVQQGGKFLELRKQSAEALMEIGVEYIAIGSLVPFFNKKHDMRFVIKVLRDARKIIGKSLPIHVYGAGDPSELPFLAALGVDIFDSSSYGHYAIQDWYMTHYGALREDRMELIEEYNCDCPICLGQDSIHAVFRDSSLLAQHNLYNIQKSLSLIKKHQHEDTMSQLLENILTVHEKWFDDSLLVKSWTENYE